MRGAVIATGLAFLVSLSSLSVAHAAITGDQPATSTAVAVITHDPREDQAELTGGTRAALDVAMDRALANPAELAMPFAKGDIVYAPVKATASQAAFDAAGAPMSVSPQAQQELGADDGSIPDDGVVDKPVEEANPDEAAFQAQQVDPPWITRPSVPKVKYGFAELDQVQQDVLDRTDLPGGEQLRTAYVDAPNNRVLVKAAAVTQELREALAARYGSDRVALYLVPGLTAPAPKANRQSDTSPFYGGAYFDGCTTSFGWVHQGKSYLLTAGHCTSLNQNEYNPNGLLGKVTADNWNNTTGSVKWNGQAYYSGDVSTIKMAAGKASSYRVYRGGHTSSASRAVTSKWNSRSGGGDRYCVSGQVTGEMCGYKVISTNVTVRYRDGSKLRNATEGHRDGRCTQGGDSGAPIYTIRSDGGVAAKGVLSGGSTNTSGSCWDYFTDTSLAEKALAGVLRVKTPR
ncbi:serine protease [Lentzea sp. NBRC 105346]|uniref:hypothetical protein n=1 Tax=Lentzea sp. NBRC 105346 TaxID=3032205 RepID=UPI0024A5A67F|nr:hypothetical protein [Lentzea sp. NBRC 105346]GLZ34201.1 serine protease [Lentzea sp. NBRC 105346]